MQISGIRVSLLNISRYVLFQSVVSYHHCPILIANSQSRDTFFWKGNLMCYGLSYCICHIFILPRSKTFRIQLCSIQSLVATAFTQNLPCLTFFLLLFRHSYIDHLIWNEVQHVDNMLMKTLPTNKAPYSNSLLMGPIISLEVCQGKVINFPGGRDWLTSLDYYGRFGRWPAHAQQSACQAH